MTIKRTLIGLGCALGLLTTALSLAAQDKYPDRPVKVMVDLPAGGGVDMIARLVGRRLATELGQPFVVDNKAGASGRLGVLAYWRIGVLACRWSPGPRQTATC